MSARNARITTNHPKPVTPWMGAYATAQASVVHGRNRKPMNPIQNELNAMLIRSLNNHTRKMASRGEKNATRATRHPHMGVRLRESPFDRVPRSCIADSTVLE